MYLLLCLALLGSVIAVPIENEDIVTRIDDRRERYVLPGESVPTFYDVELFLDPDREEFFDGRVEIRILPMALTNQIVLQALEMNISSITVFNAMEPENNLTLTSHLATDNTHMLRIILTRTIAPLVPHVVRIAYTSRFAEDMFGVYVSTYQDGENSAKLITSQLQPTYARRAFPCYDEPNKKAIFRTTIYAPPAYQVVRSNTPRRTVPLKPDIVNWDKHEFEDTLTMSSYLIAYLVSNFENLDNVENPIFPKPFTVFSRPGTREFGRFALDFGQRNMLALENYTEFDYAFDKIDKAAVPDFAAGAMENWGLVIYREAALLVQEGVTTATTRRNIARIICHENVHMWFGNEVSPQSWTYTWLNEGFANFFENYATDLVLPNYRMMDQFVLLLQGVMQNDAVLSVNPMTHPVYTPSEIIGTFNAVAYQKSGSVIRMMQHFLTPEVFRQGLVIYIRNNSRRAAVPENLYAALQEALDVSDHSIPFNFTLVMERWTQQGGFPVITVKRTAPNANSVFISQERFLTDTSLSSTDRWHVPVNWVLASNPDFEDTSPQAWVPASFPALSVDIEGLAEEDWFIFNKKQTGYYRVNYDPSNWLAISEVLNQTHGIIDVLNRAQIIDDAFNLARNGRLDYTIAFDISRYLTVEEDYIPWGAADTALSYLDIVLSGTDIYEFFQQYVLDITAPTYARLGFAPTDDDEFVTAFHRNIILNLNCRYGNEHCVEQAETLLQQFRTNPNQPPLPDIQTTVFCSGLRGGDSDNFYFLWELHENSDDPSQRSVLLNSLGCTSDETLRDFFLEQVIDDESPVRIQDKHSVLVSVINASPENMEAALDFVIEHFHEIQPRVQSLSGTTNILNAFARRLTTQEHSDKIDELYSRHNSIFSAGELASIAAIRENIGASITWSSENLVVIDSWLRQNYANFSNALSSSLILIVSALFAMLMH